MRLERHAGALCDERRRSAQPLHTRATSRAPQLNGQRQFARRTERRCRRDERRRRRPSFDDGREREKNLGRTDSHQRARALAMVAYTVRRFSAFLLCCLVHASSRLPKLQIARHKRR